MSTDPLTLISTRRTPQTERVDARQVVNSAGGYTFQLSPLAQLRRFLVLGTDGPTYYASAAELSRDNAAIVLKLAETDHRAATDLVVEISTEGRAPKQNPCLFTLAILCSVGSAEEKGHALDQLARVARTGTHLFIFARYVEQFRGWGRGLRRAVAGWYTDKRVKDLTYQVVKYRQREGWTHRDLLRLAHPSTTKPTLMRDADGSNVHLDPQADLRALFDWVTKGSTGPATPKLVEGFLRAQETRAYAPALIREYGLSWEMLPDDALSLPETWAALLEVGLPQTALIRQLPRLTRLGLVAQMGGAYTETVTKQLVSSDKLKAARVHPISVLVAARTYTRGGTDWAAVPRVIDALDTAFYAAFRAVEPAGKRTLLALDVSGSMSYEQISGMPLSPREASAALSLVTAATEPEHSIVGFTGDGGWTRSSTAITPLPISPRQRLDDVIRTVSNLRFGATDCALPMLYAEAQGLAVDTFVIYTDNETWSGKIHPHQALRRYREATGIPAKLVVVGMTSTGFSIADPSDAGMLDVAGFDSAVPSLISDFSRS